MKMLPTDSILAWFFGACAVCALLPTGVPVATAAQAPDCTVVVVRASFDHPDMVSEVTSWTDPWEINRDEGYLVVEVDEGGFARLESAGFEVVVDHELTEMMCPPRAHFSVRKPASWACPVIGPSTRPSPMSKTSSPAIPIWPSGSTSAIPGRSTRAGSPGSRATT